MTLNAGIILGGQTPDILGAMDKGRQMAADQIALNRQNALAELYRTQGAGIAAGDQNALNALAGMDPMAALGVQGEILGQQAQKQEMAFSAERMQMARDEGKRMAEEALAAQAASLTAEQLAAEKEQITKGLSGAAFFYQNKDKAGYEAFLAQNGMDPAEFPFEEFPAHAAMFEGALEAMETFAPPGTADPGERYKVVGGTLFDLQAEGGPAAVGQGAMQETMVMGPDGKPIMVQGGPGTTAKFTEAQSKDNVYATRAEGALASLEPVAGALTSRAGKVGDALSGVTLGLSREVTQDDDYQLASQAGLEFLATILRKDTGAAVTPSEEEMYGRIFLPQPGDRDALLKQKAVARVRAVEAIKAGMNPQQIMAMGAALLATESKTGVDQPTADDAAKPKAASEMSDEEYLQSLGLD